MPQLRVKEPFGTFGPEGRLFSAGDLVDDKDPVVKNRAHLFEPAEEAVARKGRTSAPVEKATAEPGEKRSVGPAPEEKAPAKKAAKKASAKKES